MDLELHDRVFIITGGTRGLGFATAEALVREGARVVAIGRSAEDVKQAQELLGGSAMALCGDLADPDMPLRAISRAVEVFGRVDGAMISVGGPPPGTVLQRSDADWVQAFESVFLGAVRMARLTCAHLMSKNPPSRNGVVGFVLSVSARQSIPSLSLSNGLRPGLAMVVSDLADEVGPYGLRTFGLLPGRIATARIESLDAATGDPEVARAQAEAIIPLRRYGTPREFGDCAAFLLSPRASYITGTCLAIDGGMLRMP